MNTVHKKHISSFHVIIYGFAGTILLGALLLMLPFASKSGTVTPFTDTLFTATSAVCVTGLVVHDTAMYWSMFGQFVIMLLIQIGGLGIVTVAVATAMISGKKIGLMQRSAMQESISAPKVGGIVISEIEELPLMPCLFETASAIGTVGLSLGITPTLGLISRAILIVLMFFERVGGLTIIFATVSAVNRNISKKPQEKITVG